MISLANELTARALVLADNGTERDAAIRQLVAWSGYREADLSAAYRRCRLLAERLPHDRSTAEAVDLLDASLHRLRRIGIGRGSSRRANRR